MEIEDGIRAIFKKRALLITGAGFSMNPSVKTVTGKALMSGQELSQQFISEFYNDEELTYIDLPKLTNLLIKENAENDLIDFIKKNFRVNEVGDVYKTLAKQNWINIYTTNYDNVHEFSSDHFTHSRNSFVLSDDINLANKISDSIIHINGSAERLDVEKLKSEFKLTSLSYSDSNFLNSPWMTKFSEDIANSEAVFVIGQSLNSDLDLKKIIISSPSYREKIFFIDGEFNDDSLTSRMEKSALEDIGQVTNFDFISFTEIVSEFWEQWRTEEHTERKELNCFDKIKFLPEKLTQPGSSKLKKISPDMQFDLLFKGNLNEKAILDNEYLVQRSIEEIKSFPDKGILIIRARLGNGKTIYIKQLAHKIANSVNRSVYWFNGRSLNKFSKEIHYIAENDPNAFIFIDDFYTILKSFGALKTLSANKLIFVLAGRSSIIDQNMHILRDRIGDNYSISQLPIDRLHLDESEEFYTLIDKSNLHSNNKPDFDKKREISSILTDSLKSTIVPNKYFTIFETKGMDDQIFELIVAVLLNVILKFNLDLDQLRNLLNLINIPDSKYNAKNSDKTMANIDDFIDIKDNKIKIDSPMLAQFILANFDFDQKRKVQKTMVKLMKAADKKNTQFVFEYMQRVLVSYSNYHLIMSAKKNLVVEKDANASNTLNSFISASSNEYYEEIQNFTFAKHNPFFWLHFAIQRMANQQWDLAERYLENAYRYLQSQKKGMGYSNKNDIDTQKIRLLLERPLYERKETNVNILNVVSTIKGLLNNFNEDDEKFVIKQIAVLPNFTNRFYNQLTVDEKTEYAIQVFGIADEIENMSHPRSENTANKIRQSLERKIAKVD